MKVERLQVASKFLEKFGFPRFFDFVTHFEIMITFQYDVNNFFSLQRITFKPEYIKNWKEVLKNHFKVTTIQLISQEAEIIVCLAVSRSKSGFFPIPTTEQKSWAIIPPIVMDTNSLVFTIIADEDLLQKFHEIFSDLESNFKILSLNDFLKKTEDIRLFSPKFTNRQREIAQFAVRHGFFNEPKRIKASAIAHHFGISESALNEHLRKVKQKLFEFFFS